MSRPSARPSPGNVAPLDDPAQVIASLEGQVADVAADSLVVEVAGIGYQVFAAPALLSTARPGTRLKLFTFHLVREDLQALYGFRTSDERGFFTLLLTVNGVGPKVALAIVGSRAVADLQLAILKLAERVILELKEKVAAAGIAAGASASAAAAGEGVGEGDVVAALQALGYSLAEARAASRAAVADSPAGSGLEDRVKAALRTLLRE
jgi:holliday junction DNA helicase RuvA